MHQWRGEERGREEEVAGNVGNEKRWHEGR